MRRQDRLAWYILQFGKVALTHLLLPARVDQRHHIDDPPGGEIGWWVVEDQVLVLAVSSLYQREVDCQGFAPQRRRRRSEVRVGGRATESTRSRLSGRCRACPFTRSQRAVKSRVSCRSLKGRSSTQTLACSHLTRPGSSKNGARRCQGRGSAANSLVLTCSASARSTRWRTT